jgi:hypothetical protein
MNMDKEKVEKCLDELIEHYRQFNELGKVEVATRITSRGDDDDETYTITFFDAQSEQTMDELFMASTTFFHKDMCFACKDEIRGTDFSQQVVPMHASCLEYLVVHITLLGNKKDMTRKNAKKNKR